MRTMLVIAITGHRDIMPAEVAGIENNTRTFFTKLQKQFPELPIRLMSPLAEGAERIVAKIALDMKIEVIVPLPMPRNIYSDDFKSDNSLVEFNELCSRCRVFELPLVEGNTLESIRYDGTERTLQYAHLGMFLSSHCHILLAVWDGKEINKLGGTSHVVKFHLTHTMPGFINNHHISPQFLAGNENDLVYHIACSRQSRQNTMMDNLSPGDAGYYTAAYYLQLANQMPDSYVRMFHQMECFNRDSALHSNGNEKISLTEDNSGIIVDEAARLIDTYFSIANNLAIKFQRLVHFSLRTLYLFAVLLGLSFLLYSDFENTEYMIWVFLFFFVSGVALFLVARRQDWHRKYLDYRALAEGLRVLFYWRVAGVADESGSTFFHDNFLQKQEIEVGWIRDVMRFVSLTAKLYDWKPNESGLKYAIDHWIGNLDAENDGQLKYFEKTFQNRTRLHKVTEVLGLMCMWIGITIAIILALGGNSISGTTQTILIALMGSFSMAAAVREAYAHKKADKELIKQYRFMHRLFCNTKQRLDETTDNDQKRDILRALGEAALDEHAEWILMHRERPLEQSKF